MLAIRPEEMRSLAAPRAALCVSIYMPLQGSQRDSQQDVIRLKNLINQADEMLAARHEAARDRRPSGRGASVEANGLFWRFTGNKGLALLIEPKALRWARSHVAFEEFVAVENRHYLAPLVRALLRARTVVDSGALRQIGAALPIGGRETESDTASGTCSRKLE